jgi:predicted nucleic acid-binding protein
MKVVPLSEEEYSGVVERAVNLRLSGSIIYDVIHAESARKVNADVILTGNGKDFARICPIPPPEIVIVNAW